MEGFWNFLSILVIVNASLVALFLILICLPQSKLGKVFFKTLGIVSYIVAGLFAVYVINPIDLIPDIIPVLGQTDDFVGIATVIFDSIIGYISLKKSRDASTKISTDDARVGNDRKI